MNLGTAIMTMSPYKSRPVVGRQVDLNNAFVLSFRSLRRPSFFNRLPVGAEMRINRSRVALPGRWNGTKKKEVDVCGAAVGSSQYKIHCRFTR